MALVRTGVNLAGDKSEKGIVSRNGTETIRAGRITYATEIISIGGCSVTAMIDSTVTINRPTLGNGCARKIRTHT